MASLKYPERLLQPFASLEHFTQELYTMLRGEGEKPSMKPARPQEMEITDADNPEAVAFKYAFNAALRGKDADESARIGASTSAPGSFYQKDPNDKRTATYTDSEPPPARAPAPRGPAETRTVYDRRREAATPPSVTEPQRVSRPVAAPAPPDDPRRPSKPDDPKRPAVSPQAPTAEERKATATTTTQAAPTPPRPKTPDPARKYPDPPPAKAKTPVTRASTKKPVDDDNPWPFIEHPIPVPGDGGGAAQPLVGKVTAAGSQQATVDLFEDGPLAAHTQTGVPVHLPNLDPDERLTAGAWLPNIYQFADADGNTLYYAYPPVWVS